MWSKKKKNTPFILRPVAKAVIGCLAVLLIQQVTASSQSKNLYQTVQANSQAKGYTESGSYIAPDKKKADNAPSTPKNTPSLAVVGKEEMTPKEVQAAVNEYRATGIPAGANFKPAPFPANFTHVLDIAGTWRGSKGGYEHGGSDLLSEKAQRSYRPGQPSATAMKNGGGTPIIAPFNRTKVSALGGSFGTLVYWDADRVGTAFNPQYLHFHNINKTKSGIIPQGTLMQTEAMLKNPTDNVHTHMEITVPKQYARMVGLNAKRASSPYKLLTTETLGNAGVAKNSLGTTVNYGNSASLSQARDSGMKNPTGTDLSPYFNKDIIIESRGTVSGRNYNQVTAFLGKTMRCRFNRLYGANLPVGQNCDYKGEMPQPLLNYMKSKGLYGTDNGGVSNIDPDLAAAMNMSALDGMMMAREAGYNLAGQVISSPVLASFFINTDGDDNYNALPTANLAGKEAQDRSPKENIEMIGKARFGDQEWAAKIAVASSKALLMELTMMNAQENFIRQQNLALRQRVEAMLAATTSHRLTTFGEKIDEMREAIRIDAIPKLINGKLEKSGDEYNLLGMSPLVNVAISNEPLPPIPEGVSGETVSLSQSQPPASYNEWLKLGDNAAKVKAYEDRLKAAGVAGVAPMHDLLKGAFSPQCAGYDVPPVDIQMKMVNTLRLLSHMKQRGLLNNIQLNSVYRSPERNKCANGAKASKHIENSAVDFNLRNGNLFAGAAAQQQLAMLCRFWRTEGHKWNMGFSRYPKGSIHIDTGGYRTWGQDYTSATSFCNGIK